MYSGCVASLEMYGGKKEEVVHKSRRGTAKLRPVHKLQLQVGRAGWLRSCFMQRAPIMNIEPRVPCRAEQFVVFKYLFPPARIQCCFSLTLQDATIST